MKRKLSYKEIVILTYIEKYPLKTIKELSVLIGCDYAGLTKIINKFEKMNKIIKVTGTINRIEIK